MSYSHLFRVCLALFALSIVSIADTVAHSTKQATVPADGAVLADSPETIEMQFDSPMRITVITITNADGDDFGLARDKSLAARETFTARPESLPAGTYEVEWRGLAEDGHAMQGGFSFTVE
jgi:methionine-rich copper-binding protein CopC